MCKQPLTEQILRAPESVEEISKEVDIKYSPWTQPSLSTSHIFSSRALNLGHTVGPSAGPSPMCIAGSCPQGLALMTWAGL